MTEAERKRRKEEWDAAVASGQEIMIRLRDAASTEEAKDFYTSVIKGMAETDAAFQQENKEG